MKKTVFRGLFTGTLSGVIASLCCLGPIILVSLGLGVLFGLTGVCLADYRFPFIIIGLAFIVLSGFFYFRKEARVCGVNLKRKGLFALFALAAMAVIYTLFVFFLVPYILSLSGPLSCSA